MNISKIFELTDEDKAKYQLMIDKIDLSKSSEVINTLNSKLDSLIDSKKLNSIETDLIKNVSVLLNIYQTYPDLTDSIKRRIIFAISYFCNSDDDIPDVVPQIGYLDDAVVARWVVDSIGNDLPEVSLA
tara:strand:+ start:485 stop:871 length:387 start_codon:yes stop_codon:yes gene_type:complete